MGVHDATALLLKPLLRALVADPPHEQHLRAAAIEVLARVIEHVQCDGIAIVHAPGGRPAAVLLAVEAGGEVVELDAERAEFHREPITCVTLVSRLIDRTPNTPVILSSEADVVFVAFTAPRETAAVPPEAWMALAAAADDGDWHPGSPSALWRTLLAKLEPGTTVIDENVQFTVYRPRSVPVNAWQTVLAFAHLAEPRDPSDPDPVAEVDRQAAAVLGPEAGRYVDMLADSRAGVPRESDVTLRLNLPGCRVNPPERVFCWEEDVHREQFRIQAPSDLAGTTIRGALTAFLGSVLLADVPLAIPVVAATGGHAVVPAAPVVETARPYRRVFASYSHVDAPVVRQVERLATVLGDCYLRDVIHLRAGEKWDQRLLEMIEEADIFQLFWSTNAMRSPHVRREWEHALSLGRETFVRPTYWESPFPEDPAADLPPESLRVLHFQPLPLNAPADEHAAAVPPTAPAAAAPEPTAPSLGGAARPRRRLRWILAPAGAGLSAIVVAAAILSAGTLSGNPAPTAAPPDGVTNGPQAFEEEPGLSAREPPLRRIVLTHPATSITNDAAVLTGTSIGRLRGGFAIFEIGRTLEYRRKVPAQGDGAGNWTATVEGLLPGTTYHYRLLVVADSPEDDADEGDDRVFTTDG